MGELMSVKPISPSEVVGKKKESIPPEVLEAFNELIAEGWNGHYSTVYQKDVVARILNKKDISDEKSIAKRGWLDVEDIYREAGWKVEYDRPAYNESYAAFFIFSKKM